MNFLNSIHDLKPQRILDLGCGTGQITDILSQIFPNATVVGIDMLRESLAEGKRLNSDPDYVQSDASLLPFPDATFDIIMMLEVVEHFDDPGKLLGEIRRVLSGNGLILISTPNRSSITAITGKAISALFHLRHWNAWDETHKHLFDPGELIHEVDKAGFTVLKKAGFWPLPEGFQRLPQRFEKMRLIGKLMREAFGNDFLMRVSFLTMIIARRNS